MHGRQIASRARCTAEQPARRRKNKGIPSAAILLGLAQAPNLELVFAAPLKRTNVSHSMQTESPFQNEDLTVQNPSHHEAVPRAAAKGIYVFAVGENLGLFTLCAQRKASAAQSVPGQLFGLGGKQFAKG